MTLSDAIRLGSMQTKPLRGQMVSPDGTAACALGSAVLAVGRQPYEVINAFPILATLRHVACPCDGRCSLSHRRYNRDWWLMSAISHLNDIHEWPREQIADWVSTIEAEHAATHPEAVAVRA